MTLIKLILLIFFCSIDLVFSQICDNKSLETFDDKVSRVMVIGNVDQKYPVNTEELNNWCR